MNEQLSKVIDPMKTFWGNLSKKNKTAFFITLAAIVVLAAGLVVWLNTPKYVILYPGMDREEAIEVMASLDERSVTFKEENGTILVPADKENSLRMDLSNEGHPRTAPNYDFFLNNTDIMSTDSQKKVIEKYQLNQRLESVIKTIDDVKNATVTITVPENDGYVLSAKDVDKQVATAGVTLTMNGGKELSTSQVSAIKRLVAKSVPNMSEDGVAVIDTATGNEMMSNDMTQMNVSQFKQTIENSIEKDVVDKIQKVINPFFGNENIRISAKSNVDINKKVQEITTYQPSQDNRGVISEEQRNSEGEKNGVAAEGIPGTDTNTTPTYPGVTADENTLYIKNNDSYKYLVDQVKEQVQKDSGELVDLTVSVAINQATITPEKKTELQRLIANAAAVPVDKVIIYNDNFAPITEPTDTTTDLTNNPKNIFLDQTFWILFIPLISLFLILILILAIIAKVRKRRIKYLLGEKSARNKNSKMNAMGKNGDEYEENDEDAIGFGNRQAPITPLNYNLGDDINNLAETKEQALKKQLKGFANQNPEIAAQLIRNWLRGGDEER